MECPRPRSGRSALRRVATMAIVSAVVAAGGCDALFLSPPPIPTSDDPTVQAILAPAPILPRGFYDYFGTLKSPAEARTMVLAADLDPGLPDSFARVGLIQITDELIADGRERFLNQPLGDPASIGQIFAETGQLFAITPAALLPVDPADDPNGALAFRRSFFVTLLLRFRTAETNLKVRPERELRLGSQVFPTGAEVATGLDIAAGETAPVGLETGAVTCAACHAAVDPATGVAVIGAPNADLNIGLFLALSPNTTSSFLRFNKEQIDPFDPRFPRTGRRILDSAGRPVTLPDPAAFEDAVDDLVLTIPPGEFEAAADATTAETKIPDCFVFGEGGMGWDGGFQIGPFGGLTALSSAVHAFEINFLTAATQSQRVADLDPEVYLGLVLQNAGDPGLRLPDDVTPSAWLREHYPDAERGVLLELPGYPSPSLFALNGVVFSPPGEPFLYSALALSAFQQSLTVPPNRSWENRENLTSGKVLRGAAVFRDAGCQACHAPPFFTDGRIIPNGVIGASPRRAQGRLIFEGALVEAVVPTFDQLVPLPADPELLVLPPQLGAAGNLQLPPGLDGPDGGYKVAGLLGTYLKAPYLHDGSVAATAEAQTVSPEGTWTVQDPAGIGVPGTVLAGRLPDAGNSLRVLLDRELRAILIANTAADPTLVANGIEGRGHAFYVDPAAGFSLAQQDALVAFLLALDDDPGRW